MTARHEVAEFFATAHHALEDMLHETSLLLSRVTDHAAVKSAARGMGVATAASRAIGSSTSEMGARTFT